MHRLCLVLGLCLLPAAAAIAEPYLAVRSGGECKMCHTNPTGGGKRNAYGNVYAQRTLASRYMNGSGGEEDQGEPAWNGQISRYLSVGADLRTELFFNDVPGQGSSSEFVHEESLLYLEFQPIPGRFSLYLDEQLGPGGANTREAYGLFWLEPNQYYLKAGQFFLPYGLRIEDDQAFIRSATGVNFQTPEEGGELGMQQGRWSAQLAVTNGSTQTDDKRASLNAAYNRSGWRIGASFNSNDTPMNEREMIGLYAGLRTGPVSWLAEYDRVRDTAPDGAETELEVNLLEGNWLISKGNNLKLTYEHRDNIDRGGDARDRWSMVWEHFPIQYLQFSGGLRAYDGPDGAADANRDEAFAQLHFFF
jgi:hypothetical protein